MYLKEFTQLHREFIHGVYFRISEFKSAEGNANFRSKKYKMVIFREIINQRIFSVKVISIM